MRTPRSPRSSHRCRVVIGADAVTALRAAQPDVPIVALVDESAPYESVRAQAAGADVVLAVPPPTTQADHHAGLELATRAAEMIADRRTVVATSSQRVGHDLAEALNVISLAAEAGGRGRLDPQTALQQIGQLAAAAGSDAWRAGHPHRSATRVITTVDLCRLLESEPFGDDVEVSAPSLGNTMVFADERQVVSAVSEMIANARRSDATWIRVDAALAVDEDRVDLVVSDDGSGFPEELTGSIGQPFQVGAGSDRLGLGLATIAEAAAELGGSLDVLGAGRDGEPTRVVLSLPTVDPTVAAPVLLPTTVDQATVQADILEGVVRHAPLDESLEAIVAAIEHQLPGTVCSILLLEDGRSLRHAAGACLPKAYREAIDGVTIGHGQGSCGTSAYIGRPVIAADVTVDRNWIDFRDVAIEHGLRSCWSTPIEAAEGGEVLGTFAVYKPTVWRPDEAAIRLVNRFTYLAAVAIEHHRLFGALAESEARFRGAFEGAAAGIALVGLDGSFLKVNPALCALVGRPATELVGASLLDLLAPADREVIVESWMRLADGDCAADSDRSVEVALEATHGTREVWLSLHTSLIAGDSDRQPYLYVEVRDITAARRQLADLRAREAAEAANRAKTDFLALASHELRTPLNAILGFAQVMQLIDLDERTRAHSVEQVVKAGRHLRDLIGGLLDLSRIESGQLSVVAEPVETRKVIDEAMELVRPLAAARDIELVADVRSRTTTRVIADRRCLRQVLINLLDNAVKYTPVDGSVEVAVTTSSDGSIRIGVTDSGPGISSDSIDEVFQPFHRLDRDGDEGEGAGLGLALCARLMKEMNGSIGADSTVGTGSCFWIEFPASPAAPAASATVVPPAGTSLDPPHAVGSVLYVEDDPACVELMHAALRLRPKITLRTAHSAAEGALFLAGEDVDLVLLDIGLPDRSGWELLNEIRTTRPDLPIIVLTAGPDTVPNHVAEPERVVTKPFDIADALRAVDVALAGTAVGDHLTEAVYSIDQ